MKYIISFILLLVLTSCDEIYNNEVRLSNKEASESYKIIIIDGCEYILLQIPENAISHRGYGHMAHKGNCNNPYHRDLNKVITP